MLQGSVPGSPVHPNVGPETYSGNTILNFEFGIVIPASTGSVTVQNNSVVNSGTAMVFQSCTGWTLSGNTINHATYGFSNAPSSLTTTASQVSFNNVGQFVQSSLSCP
jgi:UDP-N-acetylenolpyruvoylglucosamine reductase